MAKSQSRQSRAKTVGRYVPAETRGRVTRKRPTGADHSPRWFGWMLLGLLVAGMLFVVWYLVVGLVAMFSAFYLATRYR